LLERQKDIKQKKKVGGFLTNPYVSKRKLSLKTILQCLEWDTILKIGLKPPTFDRREIAEEHLNDFEREEKNLSIQKFFCASKNGSYGFIHLENPVPLDEVISYHSANNIEVLAIKQDMGVDFVTDYEFDDDDEEVSQYKQEIGSQITNQIDNFSYDY